MVWNNQESNLNFIYAKDASYRWTTTPLHRRIIEPMAYDELIYLNRRSLRSDSAIKATTPYLILESKFRKKRR